MRLSVWPSRVLARLHTMAFAPLSNEVRRILAYSMLFYHNLPSSPTHLSVLFPDRTISPPQPQFSAAHVRKCNPWSTSCEVSSSLPSFPHIHSPNLPQRFASQTPLTLKPNLHPRLRIHQILSVQHPPGVYASPARHSLQMHAQVNALSFLSKALMLGICGQRF